MNFVFLMNSLKSIQIDKDTSFILMWGAHQKKHLVYYLPEGGISLNEDKVFFHVQRVIPQQKKEFPFIIESHKTLSQEDVDAVFVRTDPPFNEDYLENTWLLDRLPPSIPVINSPTGIRTVNEKIWATRFPELVPPTIVTRRKDSYLEFLEKEKNIVIKPTNGFGGESIFLIRYGDRNAHVAFETVSHSGQKNVIVQKYIPEAAKGDKRILLLNGNPLGAIMRVHAEDDHRNNFFSGGHPEPTTMTERDLEIIRKLKPELQRLKLYFVGIDIIGDYLTEVNVTSPTCLQEMNRIYEKSLENKVIEFAENLIEDKNNFPPIIKKEVIT